MNLNLNYSFPIPSLHTKRLNGTVVKPVVSGVTLVPKSCLCHYGHIP